MKTLTLLLLLATGLSSCASGLKQTREGGFHAVPPVARGPHRTVVLFLVDGLGATTLERGLRDRAVPNLRHFFLRGRNGFALGQAAFPTQTYPNVSSILTTKPVGEQPVIANHVLAPSGKVISYEDAEYFPLLRATIDRVSVVGSLNDAGRETATFSYVFGQNGVNHMRVGIREGLEYQQHHYRSLDGRLIENLEKFLRSRPDPATWPDFLYVHLVGVDGNSHRYGPAAPQTRSYLAWLDSRLGNVLRLLEGAERRSNVVSLLTADHGFVTTTRYEGLSKLVRSARLDTVILNEGRFLALHLPAGRAPQDLAPMLEEARARDGVEMTVLRHGSVLELGKGKRVYRFAIGPSVCEGSAVSLALLPANGGTIPASGYRCPTELDDAGSAYPFLLEGMSRYLSAPNHPDALIVAAPQVSFSRGQLGSHGGPTAEESYVPVLLRNASLRGSAPIRTNELLKLLFTPAL